MGRNRGFDKDEVLSASAAAFRDRGYEATSVDDLVRVTGLHRGSLYSAFASKRGLFVRALERACSDVDGSGDAGQQERERLDLLLVALLELAPRDEQVRAIVGEALAGSPAGDGSARAHSGSPVDAGVLGRRLLVRAGLADDDGDTTTTSVTRDPSESSEPCKRTTR